MDDRQSVCATVSTSRFLFLFKEVGKNGGSAIQNRMSLAASLRENGNIEAAENAENEAKIMKKIAERGGVRL